MGHAAAPARPNERTRMNDYEALLRLQEIDLELMRHDRALKAMPQQKKMAAIDAAKRKVQGELTKIVGQRKDAELEVSESEEQHERLLRDMDEVRARAAERAADYRQTIDLEAQLTSLAKKVEKIEYRHGSEVERLDRLRKAERNARDLLERLDRERSGQQESYERASADLMAEVRKLAGERKQMLACLDEGTIAKYDAASSRFGGLAVEQLRGNVPSVCRVKLQPSQFADLRRTGSITECPYCHRLLVTEEVAG